MSDRDIELRRDRGALAGSGDEDRDGRGPNPFFEVAQLFQCYVPDLGVRALHAHGRNDRERDAGVAGATGEDVSGLERKAVAGLRIALQRKSDGEIGVLVVGIDGAEAGRGDGRGTVLGQVRVLSQESERVVLDVAALEGLQSSDALGELSADC